ncbi:MAG: hypothetical protein CM15mP4_3650 [Candidatus Neomarinimicrobiota bacterium]|nr:MAG: hypothetical protein CM15mP4_3650 [Candidatus Neomarinimicrobiota bacterium]
MFLSGNDFEFWLQNDFGSGALFSYLDTNSIIITDQANYSLGKL